MSANQIQCEACGRIQNRPNPVYCDMCNSNKLRDTGTLREISNDELPIDPAAPKRNPGRTTARIGCGILLVAVGLPAISWIALYFVSTFGAGCSECSLGWTTVIATWLAIPFILLGAIVWIVGTLIRLTKSNKK